MSSKRVAMKRCVVKCCGNTNRNAPEKIFLSLPSHYTERRIKWEQALENKVTFSSRSSHDMICEDHFNLQEDVSNWMQFKTMGSRILLKPHVLPHLYLDNPPTCALKSQLSKSDQKRKAEFLCSIEKPSSSHSQVESIKEVKKVLFVEPEILTATPSNHCLASSGHESDSPPSERISPKVLEPMSEQISPSGMFLEQDAKNWMYYKTMGRRLVLKPHVVPHKFLTSRASECVPAVLSESAKKRRLENISKLTKQKLIVEGEPLVVVEGEPLVVGEGEEPLVIRQLFVQRDSSLEKPEEKLDISPSEDNMGRNTPPKRQRGNILRKKRKITRRRTEENDLDAILSTITRIPAQPNISATEAEIKQEINLEDVHLLNTEEGSFINEAEYCNIDVKMEETDLNNLAAAPDIKEEIADHCKFNEDPLDLNKISIPVQNSLDNIKKETNDFSLDTDHEKAVNEAQHSNIIKLEIESADLNELPLPIQNSLADDVKEVVNIIEATPVDPAIGNLLNEAEYSYIDVQIEEDSANFHSFRSPRADDIEEEEEEEEDNSIYYVLMNPTDDYFLDKPEYVNII